MSDELWDWISFIIISVLSETKSKCSTGRQCWDDVFIDSVFFMFQLVSWKQCLVSFT